MDVGYPNAAVRNYISANNYYSWGIGAFNESVTGWAPCTVTGNPTVTVKNLPYGDDPVESYYLNSTTWGIRFKTDGWYEGSMELDMSNNLIAGGAQTLQLRLGLNGALDARSPIRTGHYAAANDRYNFIMPVNGVFKAGDIIVPGQANSALTNNEFGTGTLLLSLRMLRNLTATENE